MKKWHYWAIIVVLVGVVVWGYVKTRNDLRQVREVARTEVSRHMDSIADLRRRVAAQNALIDSAKVATDRANEKYRELAAQMAKIPKADSLEREEIRKGVQLFDYVVDWNRDVAAAWYGNQGLDNVELLRRQNQEMQKVPEIWMGIASHHDSIRTVQSTAINKMVKVQTGLYWRGVKTGAGAGVVLTVLAFILL